MRYPILGMKNHVHKLLNKSCQLFVPKETSNASAVGWESSQHPELLHCWVMCGLRPSQFPSFPQQAPHFQALGGQTGQTNGFTTFYKSLWESLPVVFQIGSHQRPTGELCVLVQLTHASDLQATWWDERFQWTTFAYVIYNHIHI
jgi:hypothetical protein